MNTIHKCMGGKRELHSSLFISPGSLFGDSSQDGEQTSYRSDIKSKRYNRGYLTNG